MLPYLTDDDENSITAIDRDEADRDDEASVLASLPNKKKRKFYEKLGRKTQWSDHLTGDLVDIIASNDHFNVKLIFTNIKNPKNSVIYERVLDDLKTRADARGEEVSSSIIQLRNKFKKLVGECRKAALTIKCASGIRRFQDERSYGKLFDQLFGLVKTRDSRQPEQAIEPSAIALSVSSNSCSPATIGSSLEDSVVNDELFVPVKRLRKSLTSINTSEILASLKNLVEDEPMKEYLQFAREEAALTRQHEASMMEMLMLMQHQQLAALYPPLQN